MDNVERIIEVATSVFNDEQKAVDWIDHMSATLGDTPRNLAASDSGRDRVIMHLRGIDRHAQE
jgi:uncharacterized protein (DUF2384 family)